MTRTMPRGAMLVLRLLIVLLAFASACGSGSSDTGTSQPARPTPTPATVPTPAPLQTPTPVDASPSPAPRRGDLDPTFGVDGTSRASAPGRRAGVVDGALLADGRIVLLLSVFDPERGDASLIGLARHRADG